VGTKPQLRPALSVVINQLVYDLRATGADIVALSLGEAFFRQDLFDFRALEWEKGFHYSDSRGLLPLRQKIASLYGSKYGATFNPEKEVLVTAGSKLAVYMAIKATVEPGQSVVIFEPAWVSYREQVLLAGGKPVFLPFELSYAGKLTLPKDTSLVILNNPNNPAGRVYSTKELERIYKACQAAGATLLVDEAYSDFVHKGEFRSALAIGAGEIPRDLIVTNSLSKNLGMSGWRLGYVVASAEVQRELLSLQQNLITCPPTILQQYVARYLDEIYEFTEPQIQEVISKRDSVSGLLRSLGIRSLEGSSTFYFFVDAASLGIKGSVIDYCLHLLVDHGIATVPGTAYGESTRGFVRLSIGTESLERINEALQTMLGAARNVPSRLAIENRFKSLGLTSIDWSQWPE
jgi:aspartate/methionine/tyrosine aminotransferase